MANFDLAGFGIGSICPGNELLYDDVGLPSVMVRVPKMTLSQLGMGDSDAVHPAFIINGKEVDEIWISKFQNVVHDGRAYSLPARTPLYDISWDYANSVCTAKGRGWHLMTRMEWGFLVRWCESNGFIPNGNNDDGRDFLEDNYKAIPADYYSGHVPRHTLTGTGPLSWNHNGEPGGICDLKGNAYEYNGGVRLVHGEIQVLENNDAADPDNSQSSDSPLWMAIDAATGELVTPDGNGTTSGTVKMDWDTSGNPTVMRLSTTVQNPNDAETAEFLYRAECDDDISDNAKLVLQNLGLWPYSQSDLISQKYTQFYMNNAADCAMIASGGSFETYWATIATFGMSYDKNVGLLNVGLRSAYVDLP